MTLKIYGIGRAAHFLEVDRRTVKDWVKKQGMRPFAVDGKDPFWTKEQLKELKRKHGKK